MSPEFLPADDPLVTPPGAGVGSWFQRIMATLQRSWKIIGLIFVVTELLPAIAFAVAGVLAAVAFLVPFQNEMIDAAAAGRNPSFDFRPAFPLSLLWFVLVAVIAVLFLQAAGYAAATYATTREAAGLPVTLGEALAYGFRRCAGLVGWNVVTGLLVALGVIACVLPAFYVAAATALVGPIYLFERSRPIGRSFEIFHRNLGRILGRLVLVVVIYYIGTIVLSLVENIANAVLGSTDPTAALPAAIGVSVAGTVLGLPLTVFLFVGILLTYAEQRAHEAPATAASLAAEL